MAILFRVCVLFCLANIGASQSFAQFGQTATTVGTGGTILRTDDGGGTWTPQDSGTDSHLFAVSFVDACTGTVVGAAGTILRTDDGGASWTSQNSRTTADLTGVFAVDSNTAIAVGTEATILRTDDGGARWVRQAVRDPAPSPCEPKTLTFAGVAFGDANTGVAVGNCLFQLRPRYYFNLQITFHTTNGGTTWLFNVSTTLAGFFRAVSFVSADTAMVAGDFMELRTPNFGVRVLKTTDGGANWAWREPLNRFGYPVHLYGLSYVDLFRATAVGDDSRFTPHGLIIRTVDGGANWMIQESGTTDTLVGVSFIDANNGLAVGGGTILHTSNGGETWTRQSSGVKASLLGVSFVASPCGSP